MENPNPRHDKVTQQKLAEIKKLIGQGITNRADLKRQVGQKLGGFSDRLIREAHQDLAAPRYVKSNLPENHQVKPQLKPGPKPPLFPIVLKTENKFNSPQEYNQYRYDLIIDRAANLLYWHPTWSYEQIADKLEQRYQYSKFDGIMMGAAENKVRAKLPHFFDLKDIKTVRRKKATLEKYKPSPIPKRNVDDKNAQVKTIAGSEAVITDPSNYYNLTDAARVLETEGIETITLNLDGTYHGIIRVKFSGKLV